MIKDLERDLVDSGAEELWIEVKRFAYADNYLALLFVEAAIGFRDRRAKHDQ